MARSPGARALSAVLPVLAILLASCAVAASAEKGRRSRAREAERASTRREFQKGVAFTGYERYSYVGEGPRQALRDIAAVRAEWISLLVTCYQETVASTVIDISGEGTPTDASLFDIIGYARGLGLKVLLKPHVDILEGNRWRGEIGPAFTEADWAVWFASYRSFILHYAALAAEAGADLFSIGCELDATVHRGSEWRSVIAAVRQVYPGRLIYADDQAESAPDAVTWWDALDLIGMDAYPTLSAETRPSVSSLCLGWEGYLDKLHRLSERWGKPLVITEIGYRSVEGGAYNPWDWQKRGPVDLVTQRKAYEAAFRMVAGRTWLAGIYWWQWMPDPDHGGPADTGYSPHGKPAERTLASGYRRPL